MTGARRAFRLQRRAHADERPLEEIADVERAWDEEIRRRVEALRSGRARTRPVEELLAELESRLR